MLFNSKKSILASIGLLLSLSQFSLITEKAKAGQTLNVELGASRLPAISSTVAMEAFGISTLPNGKTSIRSVSNIAKLNSLNYIPQMTAPLKKELIKMSACGARKYEIISAPFDGSGKTISVRYACDSSCVATYEENVIDPMTNSYRLKGISDEIALPLLFCETLWSGAIKVIKDAKDQ